MPTLRQPQLTRNKQFYFKGPVIGLPDELLAIFNPEESFAACRLCGCLFQSWFVRISPTEMTDETHFAAMIEEEEWRRKHNRQHKWTEHEALEKSGQFLTAEAAHVLIPFGIIPAVDLVMQEDVQAAGTTAPRMPDMTKYEYTSPPPRYIPAI